MRRERKTNSRTGQTCVKNQSSGSSVGERRENCVFAKEKRGDFVFLEHDFAELFALRTRIPRSLGHHHRVIFRFRVYVSFVNVVQAERKKKEM